jgi:putative tributyrin esterase
MALCEMHYFSTALGMQTAATVIIPEAEDQPPPYAVLYLLHGLSDDHTIWLRETSVERYAQGLPLMIVMPDGGRGFYADAIEGFAYETAIVRDLVGFVDRTFPTRAERAGRCVEGLSMGGYGAARLALRFPEAFCSAVSHSGALAFGHYAMEADDAWAAEMRRIVGPKPAGGPNDLFVLSERIDRALLPALRIDCGTEDFLLGQNREFHAHLDRLGVAHEYAEYPGAHEWAYWDVHVQEGLAFHARNLGLR